jgi:hypothetical protein
MSVLSLLFTFKTIDMLNEKKFREIYNGFLDSGLTIRDYCTNQHLTESKFFYWQNKLKGQLPPKRGFVPVVLDKDQRELFNQVPAPVRGGPEVFSNQTASTRTISCEISYPNGVCVKLNGLADLEMLRSLLLSTRR